MLKTTPPMGWNSWNTFGPDIHEQLIFETADAMTANGLPEMGYEYLVIDDCWSLKERDKPFAYTHLDVYKRQAVESTVILPDDQIQPLYIMAVFERFQIFRQLIKIHFFPSSRIKAHIV